MHRFSNFFLCKENNPIKNYKMSIDKSIQNATGSEIFDGKYIYSSLACCFIDLLIEFHERK